MSKGLAFRFDNDAVYHGLTIMSELTGESKQTIMNRAVATYLHKPDIKRKVQAELPNYCDRIESRVEEFYRAKL